MDITNLLIGFLIGWLSGIGITWLMWRRDRQAIEKILEL